jgi:hypothetical protein
MLSAAMEDAFSGESSPSLEEVEGLPSAFDCVVMLSAGALEAAEVDVMLTVIMKFIQYGKVFKVDV